MAKIIKKQIEKEIIEFEYTVKRDIWVNKIDESNSWRHCHIKNCDNIAKYYINLTVIQTIEDTKFWTTTCEEHKDKLGELK